MNIHRYITKTLTVTAAFIVATSVAYAQEGTNTYIPLSGLPGIEEGQVNLISYINALITLIITLAGIFAVVMLTLIGFQFVTGETAGPKRKVLKDKLVAVLLGVLLISSTYIILRTINPNLVNIDVLRGLEDTQDIDDIADEISPENIKGSKDALEGQCLDVNQNDQAQYLQNDAQDYLDNDCYEDLGGNFVEKKQKESCVIDPLIGEDVPGFTYELICY